MKNDLHAWFPDEWNPQKLINILKAGLEQVIKAEYSGEEKIPNAYEIIVEYENVIIKIVQSKNTNKIITAFPLTQMVITNLEAHAWFFIKKLKYKTSDEDNEPGGTETIGGETDDKDGEDEKDLE